MSTERKFAAFTRNTRGGLGISEIPKDGFCISVFLILKGENDPRGVLMGYLNPEANWAHIGALTQDRIDAHSKGWMLPSSHIIFGESPNDAAKRVFSEQLGIEDSGGLLTGPKVFSEVYAPRRHSEAKEHWDLQFLFEGRITSSDLLNDVARNAWKKLDFIDIDSIEPSKISRSHEDILSRIR
ncbi:MAG TPA: NUDIX hydrolase [Nitrososphaerales archaeon]|nr:NUDIX hydrolase [Nitrososphaerales archaeon]